MRVESFDYRKIEDNDIDKDVFKYIKNHVYEICSIKIISFLAISLKRSD